MPSKRTQADRSGTIPQREPETRKDREEPGDPQSRSPASPARGESPGKAAGGCGCSGSGDASGSRPDESSNPNPAPGRGDDREPKRQ